MSLNNNQIEFLANKIITARTLKEPIKPLSNNYVFGMKDAYKIQSFIIPPKTGINYKPGIWHFPLISTEDTNFLVIDRRGGGENLIIHKFEKENIIINY